MPHTGTARQTSSNCNCIYKYAINCNGFFLEIREGGAFCRHIIPRDVEKPGVWWRSPGCGGNSNFSGTPLRAPREKGSVLVVAAEIAMFTKATVVIDPPAVCYIRWLVHT